MKTRFTKLLSLMLALIASGFVKAQDNWPKVIPAQDGMVIRIYQPEPESFSANVLKFRSAISIKENGQADPVFGTIWSTSKVQTDRNNREVELESVAITDIKIPAETEQGKLDYIRSTLEAQLPATIGALPMDELLATLDQTHEQARLSNDINTKAPRVIYAAQPSILVQIDGNPKLERNTNWGMDAVVNSPFTIVKYSDDRYYLYGGHHWYQAPSALGPYSFADQVPSTITAIETAAAAKGNNQNEPSQPSNNNTKTDVVISNIIISTSPAELVQSNGEANFSPLAGTGLLYVKNSDNDIFMDVNTQLYYVLISGRWYRSKALGSNQWEFVAADRLPADFARIPEGSPKDNVLASVAGTDAAREAVMDAQIPQTAKVDRHNATTSVTYNGQPTFENINGTNLQYAVNTSSTVLRENGQFYTVDNGVWFVSENPAGPWTVATERPEDLDQIPPSNPAYNTKYVYVYDVTPDYVYMGYTPGYLNSFIYGPTIVYGTGYYYNPWHGGFYYPRPWSWGFNIGYNPWYGWSFGFGYSLGWFNIGWGGGWGGYYGGWYHGGWWGPHLYHPAYCGWGGGWGAHPYGGYYGNNVTINQVNNYVRVNNTNNIYVNRGGLATRDNSPFGRSNTDRQFARNQASNASRPTSFPQGSNTASSRPAFSGGSNSGAAGRNNNTAPGAVSSRPNSVFSDRQGNVYQRNEQGWQQRNNRSWAPVQSTQRPEVVSGLDRQQMMRDRGQVRTQNFQSARSTFGGSAPRSNGGGGGGGGSRPSGGGGGGGGSRSSGGGGGSGGSHSGRR